MNIKTILGKDYDLDKYNSQFPLAELSKMFPDANIMGFEWVNVKEDLKDDFNLGVRKGGTPEAQDSLGADFKINGWKVDKLPPIIDENDLWVDGRTRRREIKKVPGFEGWLPVLRIRMKDSDIPQTKKRSTAVKANFHAYAERTKMKDIAVAVTADILDGECKGDKDSILTHMYQEYSFHEFFDVESGIDTKVVNIILKKLAGGTLVKELNRDEALEWLGSEFDKEIDILLAVGGNRDEQLFLRHVLANPYKRVNVILYTTETYEEDAIESVKKFLKDVKEHTENAFKFVSNVLPEGMEVPFDGELPFNLRGIIPTIQNDKQKKSFDKGQLISAEDFLNS